LPQNLFKKHRAVRHKLNQHEPLQHLANQDAQHTGGKIWTWRRQTFSTVTFSEKKSTNSNNRYNRILPATRIHTCKGYSQVKVEIVERSTKMEEITTNFW